MGSRGARRGSATRLVDLSFLFSGMAEIYIASKSKLKRESTGTRTKGRQV